LTAAPPVGLITLTDISAPQILAQISEADVGRVKPGQRATFSISAFPLRQFAGTVAAIQPVGQSNFNVVTYGALISVDPTDVQLLPMMTAIMTIVVEQVDDVVLVPNAAITFAQAGRPGNSDVVVLVERNGQTNLVPIQAGETDGQSTVALSGIDAGEQVVIGASGSSRS
jgi:HlyD family secretion protein